MKNVIDHFSSKDFYLVAVCLAAGCKLKAVERQISGFVTFILEEPPFECEQIISRHWSGNLNLQSRKLIESINELKTRLHSGI